jgi:hypothetical protein
LRECAIGRLLASAPGEDAMKEQRSNREAKKPKKEKPKTIAAAASTKNSVVGDQVAKSNGSGKK